MGGHGDGDEVDTIWFEAGVVEEGVVAAVFGFDGEESGPVAEVAGEGFLFSPLDHLFACVAADAVGEVGKEVPDCLSGSGADVHAEVAFALVEVEDRLVEWLWIRVTPARSVRGSLLGCEIAEGRISRQ